MALHGTRCICQICTCGRHRCPNDRNASSIDIGTSNEDYLSKKNAACGNQSTARTTLAATENVKGAPQRSSDTNFQDANVRITSGALRRRNNESSIVFGSDDENERLLPKRTKENAISFGRPSRQESKEYEDVFDVYNVPARKIRGRSNRSTEARDVIGLILQPIDEGRKQSSRSVYSVEYTSRKGDRYDPKKSCESDIWKNDEVFVGVTQTSTEFTPKKGERYNIKRPQTSDIWKHDGHFEGKTVSHQEYTEKRGEKYPCKKPIDSKILEHDESPLVFETSSSTAYTPKKGLRYESVIPETSEIWKKEGSEYETVTRYEYKTKTGERYPTAKPEDSEIFDTDKSFLSTTHNSDEFTAKMGERYEVKRPVESDIWKQEGKMAGKTVSQEDFTGGKGERYPTSKPQDSDILRGDRSFLSEVQTSRKYTTKRDEQSDNRFSNASDVRKQGREIENRTVMQGDYVGRTVERYPMLRTQHLPEDNSSTAGTQVDTGFEKHHDSAPVNNAKPLKGDDLVELEAQRDDRIQKTGDHINVSNLEEANLWKKEGATVSRNDFAGQQGERRMIMRPKDSDVFRGDGAFRGETHSSSEYTPKSAERYDVVSPKESDIWKKEGHLESTTTSHQDFTGEPGDRFSTSKPLDSDFLHGDGIFRAQTQSSNDYVAKTGEHCDVIHPGESDVWKQDGSFGQQSVSHQDYKKILVEGERCEIVKPKDSNILQGDNSFTYETDKSVAYTPKSIEKIEAFRPQTSDIWKTSGSIRGETVSHQDYTRKSGERYPKFDPQDSNILYGDGSFMSSTQNSIEFTAKIGERCEVVEQKESDIWKHEGEFDGQSVSHKDYTAVMAERCDSLKPKDSKIFYGEDSFTEKTEAGKNDVRNEEQHHTELPEVSDIRRQEEEPKSETVSEKDNSESCSGKKSHDLAVTNDDGSFATETRNRREHSPEIEERANSERSEDSSLWQVGNQVADQTDLHQEYAVTAEGERFLTAKSPDSEVPCKDDNIVTETENSGKFIPQTDEHFEVRKSDLRRSEGFLRQNETISRKDDQNKKTERYSSIRPKDTEQLREVGSFGGQKQKGGYLTNEKGERYKVFLQNSSPIWEQNGNLEIESVSRQEFQAKKGDRYAVKKPHDSDILHGDGMFRAETSAMTEFTAKAGERPEIVKHNSSDIWKMDEVEEGSATKNKPNRWRTAYTETFYEGVRPEDIKKIIHHEQQFHPPKDRFESQSEYRTSFTSPAVTLTTASASAPARKLHESMLQPNGAVHLESLYNTEFVPKLKSCPAGELIESIAKNHCKTEHFEFYRVLGGHHFYEPKADIPQKT